MPSELIFAPTFSCLLIQNYPYLYGSTHIDMLYTNNKPTKIEGLTIKGGRLINERKEVGIAPITQAAIDRKKNFKSRGEAMPPQPGMCSPY
jgi:regulator of PEP synthase PpsR (kinase-PPPase family)